MMHRYKLTIEYDGTPYSGWQRQINGHTVQAAVETAVQKFSSETASVFGAGRTDSGVHALGQVAHLDLSRAWPVLTIRDALNAYLVRAGETVSIIDVEAVPEDFDARFSAIGRRYLFRIIDRRPPLTVERNLAWRSNRPLDVEQMHEAAQALIGTHDFTTFRALGCQAKSPIRTLDVLNVARRETGIEINAGARSFLHNQIRSIAGTLKLVGEGKWNRGDVENALAARRRTACGPVAPPHGLYLMAVDYPERLSAAAVKVHMSTESPR